MRTAYSLLGVLFIFIFVSAFFLISSKEVRDTESTKAPPTNLETNQEVTQQTMSLELTSSAFEHNRSIPSSFTCDGNNINPEFLISNVPEGTRSLVLLMDDPDIPDFVKESRGIEKFDHWTLFNISPDTTTIAENSAPEGAVEGKNSGGENGYTGPCPPDREHRYFFKLYALDSELTLTNKAIMADIEKAMEGRILEEVTLIGLYNRNK